MSHKIPYAKPSITELEVRYATDAVANGWGEHCYEYIDRFEAAFRDYVGTKYAIATSSCTGALHLGMAALGIGPGDEVILADSNWIATAAPIFHLGAKPIFVDVLRSSWCIDPDLVEPAITPRTKAIVAVHLYGNLCDMDRLISIGDSHGIPVIEDAAEAIGSTWHSKKAGSIGKFGAFSFHGTKTLTTGEGGMFITNDDDLFERVLTLSNHGRSRSETRQFWPELVGFKYKMSNVQAAIGLAQLERIDELVAFKRDIFFKYSKILDNHQGISMNSEPPGTTNGYWMPTVVFDSAKGIHKAQILAAFREAQIDARVFFNPLSSLPMFSPKLSNVVSYGLSERSVNLPSFVEITDDEIRRVIRVVEGLLS